MRLSTYSFSSALEMSWMSKMVFQGVKVNICEENNTFNTSGKSFSERSCSNDDKISLKIFLVRPLDDSEKTHCLFGFPKLQETYVNKRIKL